MATKQQTKPFWKSSTLWINGLGIAITAAELAVASDLIPDPQYVALIVAVLNIANRFRAPKTIKTLTR